VPAPEKRLAPVGSGNDLAQTMGWKRSFAAPRGGGASDDDSEIRILRDLRLSVTGWSSCSDGYSLRAAGLRRPRATYPGTAPPRSTCAEQRSAGNRGAQVGGSVITAGAGSVASQDSVTEPRQRPAGSQAVGPGHCPAISVTYSPSGGAGPRHRGGFSGDHCRHESMSSGRRPPSSKASTLSLGDAGRAGNSVCCSSRKNTAKKRAQDRRIGCYGSTRRSTTARGSAPASRSCGPGSAGWRSIPPEITDE